MTTQPRKDADEITLLWAILETQNKQLAETKILHRDVVIVGGVYLLTVLLQFCAGLLLVRP